MTRDWPFEPKLTRKFQITREKVFVMHCFVWWFFFSRGFLGFVNSVPAERGGTGKGGNNSGRSDCKTHALPL